MRLSEKEIQAIRDRENSNPKYLYVNVLGCRYVFSKVESGSFTMGENEEAHKVILSKPYYIGIHEITQEQWNSIMKTNPSEIQGKKHPVENITWHEAKEFCKRLESFLRSQLPLGYHINLPTEAQWEYAAAGGHLKTKKHRYSGSSNVDDVAWFGRNSKNTHHEVGQKRPNELGVFDMCGNVWELCLDWVGPYSKYKIIRDPMGPSKGTDRQCRGGSWRDSSDPTIKLRHWAAPNGRFPDLGFRIVLSQSNRDIPNGISSSILETDGSLILDIGVDHDFSLRLDDGIMVAQKINEVGTHQDLKSNYPHLYFEKPACLAGKSIWYLETPLVIPNKPARITKVVVLHSGRQVAINKNSGDCRLFWNSNSISIQDYAFGPSEYKIKICF